MKACKKHFEYGIRKPGTWGNGDVNFIIVPHKFYADDEKVCQGAFDCVPVDALEMCCNKESQMTVYSFPQCCGAAIFGGLSGLTTERLKAETAKLAEQHPHYVGYKSGPGVVLAISCEINGPAVHQAFIDNDYKIVTQFMNPLHGGGGILTLWSKTFAQELYKPEPKLPRRIKKASA